MTPYRSLAVLALMTTSFGAYAASRPHKGPDSPLLQVVAQSDATDFRDQGGTTLAAPLLPSADNEKGSPVRTVVVKGTGESVEAAQRDAARTAVQQVAGLYIDARRKVDSKITDKDVSEIVEEKILSYTNAYITKLQVTKTDRRNGSVVVEAKVSVRVAPLVKTLGDAKIPTIPFDTATAIGQVEVSSHEKSNAIDLYADLLRRADDLITLGAGTPKIDTRLQAPPDQSWLSIPITFKANDEAIRDWRTKCELIATQRAQLQVPISQAGLNRAEPDRACNAPVFDTSFALNNGITQQTFTGTITPDGEHGLWPASRPRLGRRARPWSVLDGAF